MNLVKDIHTEKSTAIKQDSTSAKTELVFRMLNYTLGESTFKHGLQKFMADRQYKTFFGDDIWLCLTEQAKFDEKLPESVTVNEIAASWITKDRLPVVTVHRNYEDHTATLTQRIKKSSTTTTTTVSKYGTFSNCTSRFDGKVNSNVEASIDSIVVYKDCVDISDKNALKGLPMLLNEPASTWWQGIKSSITTFEDALLELRHAYGYAKPPSDLQRIVFQGTE
ncbi:hypothetical protein NQ314_006463 [Rhamnusium bicolor]|uniref:Peptidase M1 membrane alanine aminopeptidase domain-containing protein n=1 Tax=Rhamnusium bicolor TaxID=1586634 RepID=A0AAV8Z1N6_9CUCU|nr:hypothetical protein NQ314_006463 [Rhamnusium bicolor]